MAMNARCPECDDGFGELVQKSNDGGDVVADFECAGCGHEWSVSI
jgi:hypothetical protein